MRALIPALAALALAGCGPLYGALGVTGDYQIRSGDLDDGTRKHQAKLVSALGAPSAASKSAPVAVVVHGFSATEWETNLIADQLRSGGYSVSQTLLGGHGESVQAFEQSNWRTWSAPVLKEIQDLRALGYTNISLVGASTGCTVLLEGIASKSIDPVPPRIVLISPMIEPSSKLIGYTGVLTWMGVKAKVIDATGSTLGNWYNNWPATTLISLLDFSEVIKARLAAGLTVPAGTKVLVLQSKVDGTVDPKGAEMLRQGLKGGEVTVQMLDSTLHVPVRPDGLDAKNYTPAEATLRTQLLQQIQAFLGS